MDMRLVKAKSEDIEYNLGIEAGNYLSVVVDRMGTLVSIRQLLPDEPAHYWPNKVIATLSDTKQCWAKLWSGLKKIPPLLTVKELQKACSGENSTLCTE